MVSFQYKLYFKINKYLIHPNLYHCGEHSIYRGEVLCENIQNLIPNRSYNASVLLVSRKESYEGEHPSVACGTFILLDVFMISAIVMGLH